MLLAVKALIDSTKTKKESDKTFPRGVKVLSGDSNICVPGYAVLTAWEAITKVDRSQFLKLHDPYVQSRKLIQIPRWISHQPSLPARCMTMKAFVDWCQKLWEERGRCMESMSWGIEPKALLDLNFEYGHYTWHQEDSGRNVYTHQASGH
eukprot:6070263-Lingulodinium_polyedra.AAC.1